MPELNIDYQAVRDYLGIEEENDTVINRNIARQAAAADRYLQAAIHADYDREDPRAQELAVMVTAELYDNRGIISARADAAFRRIAHEFMQQMRLEKRED